MKLSLLANAALAPLLTPLRALSPHKTSVTVLSDIPALARRQLRAALENAFDADALLLLDGMDLLPESGWRNGEVPLVVPRVHNTAALLLGNANHRRLFTLYDGGICWFLPGGRRPFFTAPEGDCQALCYLADTQLDLPDSVEEARSAARYHEWDYLEASCDFSRLESLLGGQWDARDAAVYAPGQTVLPW